MAPSQVHTCPRSRASSAESTERRRHQSCAHHCPRSGHKESGNVRFGRGKTSKAKWQRYQRQRPREMPAALGQGPPLSTLPPGALNPQYGAHWPLGSGEKPQGGITTSIPSGQGAPSAITLSGKVFKDVEKENTADSKVLFLVATWNP